MRGRPKVLLARTYEEAYDLFTRYQHNVLGVISDISFSREGQKDQNAGLRLAQVIRSERPEIPVLLQSTDSRREQDAFDLGASFIWKQSPTLLADLNTFMNRHYGFGPFIFRDPESGMPHLHVIMSPVARPMTETLGEIPIGETDEQRKEERNKGECQHSNQVRQDEKISGDIRLCLF